MKLVAFGMRGLFTSSGYLFASLRQNYTPRDKQQLAYYSRRLRMGQILMEGTTEAGLYGLYGLPQVMSYSTNRPMI